MSALSREMVTGGSSGGGRMPHLSVVATSRNDDHGGDLSKRMQLFVTGLAAQANRHRVSLELIMVEWNPPGDRPALRDALAWPEPTEFFEARIVTVPAEVHATLDPTQALPLFQMIAKNVGIRRARGRFVLATNVDLLFPDELFVALLRLTEGRVYRNDRHDISREIPGSGPMDELLAFCRANVIRIHRAEGTFLLQNGRWTNANANPPPKAIWRSAARRWLSALRGYPHQRVGAQAVRDWVVSVVWLRYLVFNRYLTWLDRYIPLQRAVLFGLEVMANTVARFRAPLHASGDVLDRAREIDRIRRKYVRLHTNGCGDFTLLDRETWFRLRGYPEWPVFSWHLDSVFLLQTEASGLSVEQLPARQCTYHIDHGGGWTPEEQARLFQRLQERGIRFVSDAEFYQIEKDLEEKQRERRVVTFNPGNWGFVDLDLRDETLGPRSAGGKDGGRRKAEPSAPGPGTPGPASPANERGTTRLASG